jgi:uncharacterized repeat protein (TIGR03803 family)
MIGTVHNCDCISGVRGRATGMMVAVAVGMVLLPAVAVSRQAERPAQAPTYTLLYSFTGGTDGANPFAGLVRDAAGNLYGTTDGGGAGGAGVVFKLDIAGAETVLHSFIGPPTDGGFPDAGLVRDAAGDLFGTTSFGGAFDAGVVFKLDKFGKEIMLHSFAGYPTDGANPYTVLVRDTAGNFYGTTLEGGPSGDGVVFKLNMAGYESVLFSFNGAMEGGNPGGGLVRDAAGNLYGTTSYGGAGGCPFGQGCGVVFKFDPTGNETLVHSFAGSPADGGVPSGGASVSGGLVRDAAGNLYGTTYSGGASDSGVVFKLTP